MMKKITMVVLFIFSTIPIFGQQYIWSTVGGRVQKTIQMNSVKSEVLKIVNQNDWVLFSWDSTNHYTTRNEYREFRMQTLRSEQSVNNDVLVAVEQQMIYWLDNYQNFVSAYVGPMFSLQNGRMVWYDYYTVHFVIGDKVVIMGFTDTPPVQRDTMFPTQNQNNRRILEEIIDDLLMGFPQTSQNSSTASTYSGSSNNSGDFLIGYNYSFGFPLGFTIGYSGFYASLNLGLTAYYLDGVTSGSSNREGVTGETKTDGLEFTIGYSFKLIDGILRLPVGIGMSLTDEYQYYHDSAGNTGWYGDGNLEDKKFIAEAGLQLILIDFLYLSTTYRLIGFSKSGFTIGGGFIF